jgi:uncharacterized DUF497 family protein
VDIECDPSKAASNVRKHGVSFADAEQALRDPLAVTIEDPDAGGEQRFVTLGMDFLGRVLVIVYTLRESAYVSSPPGRPAVVNRSNTMRKEYDFSKGRRGAVIPSPGKTRITIMVDDDVLEFFRSKADASGTGYQTLINAELKAVVAQGTGEHSEPLTAARLRQILREELHAA